MFSPEESRAVDLPVAALLRVGAAFAVGLAVLVSIPRPGLAANDGPAGRMLYENKCGGCHSVDGDRIGPRHRNVVGRRVASVPGYAYSPALKKLGGTWTSARLDQWLSGTQKMAPGGRMYLEIDDPAQRRAIIAFLNSVSKPPSR